MSNGQQPATPKADPVDMRIALLKSFHYTSPNPDVQSRLDAMSAILTECADRLVATARNGPHDVGRLIHSIDEIHIVRLAAAQSVLLPRANPTN